MKLLHWVMKMMILVPEGNGSVALGNENDDSGIPKAIKVLQWGVKMMILVSRNQ